MGKTVLTVDDSTFIQAEMKRILENTEFELVGFTKTGEKAMELYRELQPDIVTMDIILPGIDGIDTAKLILSEWPDARIVMMSSLAYEETMAAAKEMGARGFIYKPFEAADVIKALNEALH